FKHWFQHRPRIAGQASCRPTGSDRAGKMPALLPGSVVLWPDTFNNYFHPWVAQAAVEVLEDAGFQVIVPQQDMCCGRPLYDYGMLETAKKWLRNILHQMPPYIEAGLPLVVLEPSCGAAFRG